MSVTRAISEPGGGTFAVSAARLIRHDAVADARRAAARS